MALKFNSSATRVAYVIESTPGVIPVEPVWQVLRITGETLDRQVDTIVSGELDPSRNVSDQAIGSGRANGGFTFEFQDGSFEDVMRVGTGGAWVSDVLVNGIEETSIALEVTYSTSEADLYKRYSQCYIDNFSLQFSPGAYITGSASILGAKGEYDDAIVTDATYTNANAEPAMVASLDFGSLVFSGLTIDTVTSMSMKWDNQLRPRYCLNGSIDPESIGFGQFVVTGDIELYLSADKLPLLQSAIANEPGGVSFILGKTALKKTKFELPRIKLGSPKVMAEGNNNDVMIKAPFQAFKSATIGGATVRVTRNLA